MTANVSNLPSAWAILAQAIAQRRPVRARYHDHERLLCPHALGWKHGQAKVLAFQAEGATNHGPLPLDPRQRWRSLFVDDIDTPTITDEQWSTAPNYCLPTSAIDTIAFAIQDLK
jgi:hypothetical protein